jgi:hypothetical protein
MLTPAHKLSIIIPHNFKSTIGVLDVDPSNTMVPMGYEFYFVGKTDITGFATKQHC